MIGKALGIIALAAFLTAASPAPKTSPTPQPTPDPLERLTAAYQQLLGHVDTFQKLMGEYETSDLSARLEDDISALSFPQTPEGVAPDDWQQRLDQVAALDSSIVEQVLAGPLQPLAGVQGLQERMLASSIDGRLQPIAIYVPPTAGPHPSLVVLLHGRPQTETQLLGWPYFRALADGTGTIIAAPYGRGSYDYEGPASQDVYQITDAMVAAYDVDPHHVYLAGYSMGGFTVFKVGPLHGARWSAILCIGGAILNSETAAVRSQLQGTPFYVVTGKHDVNIPAQYGELTADYLAGVGINTEFDEQPDGTHYLSTLIPALTTAWDDMLAGVVKHRPEVTIGDMPGFTMPQTDDSLRP